MKLLILCAVAAMVFTPAIAAQDNQIDESTLMLDAAGEPDEDGSVRLNVFSAWDFIRMILILAAVIGVIFLIFLLLKRSGNPRIQENRMIRVLSTKALTNSRTLHLVEVGKQVFLIGAAESNISLVSEIIDKETLDGIHLQTTDTIESDRKSFSSVISQMFGKEKSTAPQTTPVSLIRQQRQRIRQM